MPRPAPRRIRQLEAMRPLLDDLYRAYNRPEFIALDPLAAVRRYASPDDQALVGLIAASLAFGNVKTILASIDRVLALLPSPHADLLAASPKDLARGLAGFRHRYADEHAMRALLLGAQAMLRAHGSLLQGFRAQIAAEDADVQPGLARFSHVLREAGGQPKNYLLADASKGSASKRWHMYLRWMVRRDAVDPGPWHGVVDARLLLVPIDTHMHRFCRGLGLSRRNSADLRTAREVTEAFRVICPEDPTRYDFALTRLGIRRESAAAEALLAAATAARRAAC